MNEITLFVASMATPAFKSRLITSTFPNLAALIKSVSSFSCMSERIGMKNSRFILKLILTLIILPKKTVKVVY